MSTANEILNFNFPYVALQEAAKNTFPETLIQLSELRISKLNKITEIVGETSFKFDGDSMYPKVYKKFHDSISNNSYQLISINNFDKRELKTLSYCLDYSESNKAFPIIASEIHLNIALNTLQRNWKDSFLFGLIRCYLKNWETKHSNSIIKLYEFIIPKLKQYNGGRTVLKSFQTNIKFFDIKNGDVVLGSELALRNKNIKHATKHLSLPDNWFAYPYFSKVIVAYYEKRKAEVQTFVEDLNNALSEHNNSISNKRLVSKLIIQANTNEFTGLQDNVKSIAFRLVGDSGNAANWIAFEIATENEIEDLKKARIILNEWITRQFIKVFFEKCINDTRRKRFWLKYAKEITQFRVVGSTYIRQLLMTDNRINEYVTPRFGNTNSSRDGNAALMFTMKNHLFIEFSDTGAFYAYKLSNTNAPSIESSFFESTSSLKTPTMNLLAYRTGCYIDRTYDEGRLGHNDGDLHWEQVAQHWLKNIAGIDV